EIARPRGEVPPGPVLPPRRHDHSPAALARAAAGHRAAGPPFPGWCLWRVQLAAALAPSSTGTVEGLRLARQHPAIAKGPVPGGGGLPRLADHARRPGLRRAGKRAAAGRGRRQHGGGSRRAALADRLGVAALSERPVAPVTAAAGARGTSLRPGSTGFEP